MLILIALLVSISIFLIAYLLISKSTESERNVSQRLRRLGGNESGVLADSFRGQQMNKSLARRIFDPLADKVAKKLAQITPKGIYAQAEVDVEKSGGFNGYGIRGFMLFLAGHLLLFMVLAIYYVMTHDGSAVKNFIILIGAFVMGAGVPFMMLKSAVEERQDAIRHAMPDVLDLLCVSVQAGLGFDGALGKVTAKMKGPLIEELERLLQELRMGVTRRTALLRLAERCGIQEMQLFTAALIQADKLGVGMAQVLEVQSENMRQWRRQRAREQAAKLPVKILAPTLVFIFPVMFLVVLGPPLVTILNSFMNR